MVAMLKEYRPPLNLVVTGEAESWLPALRQIVGPKMLRAHQVATDTELLDVVGSGVADAAVLDEEVGGGLEVLQLLRMIRRLDALLPVVVVTDRHDRHLLEGALRLTAFSVLAKPLELEALLQQILRIMERLDKMLRRRDE